MRFLLTAAVFTLCVPAKADDAAKALVEKAVKAQGFKPGDKASPMAWKDKGTFSAMGLKMEYTGDWTFEGPDKYRFAIDADFGGMKVTFTVGVSGAKAWQSAMGRTEDITGDKLEYTLNETYQLHVLTLLPLLAEKEFNLTATDGKDVGTKKTKGVKVTREKRPDVHLYFDADTGLLAKAEMKAKDEFQGWKEVQDELFFDEYTTANGKKMFGKIRIVRDGKPLIESAHSGYAWPAKLDPKTFEKP